MNKIMKKILIALVVIAAVLGIYKAIIFIKIDICLDQGGRWNYELGNCEDGSAMEFKI
jgi:hypothetical protein